MIPLFLSLLLPGCFHTQQPETVFIRVAASKDETLRFKRVIQFDTRVQRYHVEDFFENGQRQMDAYYSALDKTVKESYACDYHSNTKEGAFQEWYENGQRKYVGKFHHGRRSGVHTSWYANGQLAAREQWFDGQLHGHVTYWTEQGQVHFEGTFSRGKNINPKPVSYPYLSYTPSTYERNPDQTWPLIIYLHGGSQRGSDLGLLYNSGIPDQIYRGRAFPFILIAPQCPTHLRWSTEEWFDELFQEILREFRVDTNRVYLTGESLGGSGTWYLAIRYPEKFAAIAPIAGFTTHMDFILQHSGNLKDTPIWAFHGEADTVVPFYETESMVKRLASINREVRFSAMPDVGHWIHWLIYPEQELYDWFLEHTLKKKKDETGP